MVHLIVSENHERTVIITEQFCMARIVLIRDVIMIISSNTVLILSCENFLDIQAHFLPYRRTSRGKGCGSRFKAPAERAQMRNNNNNNNARPSLPFLCKRETMAR